MNAKKKRILLIGGIALAVCLAVVALVLILGGGGSGEKNWTYTYEWNGSLCTATRVSGRDKETETVEGVLTVQSPATMDKDGNGYYTVRFKNPDFNTNYNLGRQPVVLPAGSDFVYGKAGLNTYLFDSPASKYYYAQVDIEASTQAGWVGFVHSADETFSTDGTYFYDTVSYKAGRNYEHGFGSVLYGSNLFENKELADAYEGPTKKGLTGVDFSIDGMTLTTLRCDDQIYLFINGKRVATYLIDRDLAISDTLVGLYFNNNSTFYSGSLSNIKVVEGKEETEAKLAEFLKNSESFVYSNIQNWNKNEGLHTDATFGDGTFTYKYDDTLDLSNIDKDLEGYTHDRRYMTGVTDRVFLSGNYYYQYEISGPIKGINDPEKDLYGLFFNYVNSAQRSGIYYRQEAMWSFKENDGLERVRFDAGKGVNGDGVSGWTGGTAFGGSDNLKTEADWQAAYQKGLIVRISRAAYEDGEHAVYGISVSAKSNPNLVLLSKQILVNDEDKGDIYGGYDWIMFATQSVNCTISNITYGRVEGEVEFGHDPDWRYSYAWHGAECTATRTCKICGEKETETVKGLLITAVVPTKETAGKATYKAVFKNDDYNKNAWAVCKNHTVTYAANAAFSGAVDAQKYFGFDGVRASKNYYVEMKLSAPTEFGYVGLGHVGDKNNFFYNMVCNGGEDGNYYYRFASKVNGKETVHGEIAEFIEGVSLQGLTGVDYDKDGMTLAVMRMDDTFYAFINGIRIGTYLVENEIAKLDTVPVVFIENFAGGSYDGKITDVVILDELSAVQEKFAQLVTGNAFSYVGTPNWRKSGTDAIFNADGFAYAYDTSNPIGERRFNNGVNDRVFLSGNYYYQYEISGNIACAQDANKYGLFFNWINTKQRVGSDGYKHEAIFSMKVSNDGKLQRLTFDQGKGAYGDGATGGWSINTTTYGGNTSLENNAAWQAAAKNGLIVRIERTVKDAKTDVYVISVTAKNDPELQLVSKPIEASHDTYGGYNWILFGTQSVNCTISNVTFGRMHTYSDEGEEILAPTCGEPGTMRYYCTDEGFEHLYIEKEIPATGQHSNPEYTYTWSGSECTATRVCPGCQKTETETVRGQVVSATPATKYSAGKATYNAVFEDADFNDNATDGCTGYEVVLPANTPFGVADDRKQQYVFDGVDASKVYYIEMRLSAPTKTGYVGVAHWAEDANLFYDTVSYSTDENYYHAFSQVVGGVGRVYSEPAKYYKDTTAFGQEGMTLATLRAGDTIYTFVNGKRIGTYLLDGKLAQMDTMPVLYFEGANGGYYDGQIDEIVIVSDASVVNAKLAELTAGSDFGYVATPNFHQSFTDTTFTDDGFTYAYDSANSASDRRFVTGVNDRVFLSGNYYYQYEISGDMAFANGSNVYGLLYNWINTKSLTQSGNYKHEVNFVLKLNGDKLQRLTFDKGSGANGDGASGWVSNTTAYGGRNDLENDAAWQAAYKDGLIVRIERTVKDSKTDIYVISVTAKSDPSLKLTSTPVEVSDDTFGGFNWILFGTQSVDCTISNVEFGQLHDWQFSYTWNGDQCTATRTCKSCNTSETETVQGELVKIIPATKDIAGKAVYNAVFLNAIFQANAPADCIGHEVELPANTPFAITEGGKQTYAFDGIAASKNYYIEVKLGASVKAGYVGLAHWADANNHFYDVVSYDATESYYHAFSGVVNGSGRVYSEPAKFFKDSTAFGQESMTFATLRMDGVVYTFVNGKRIATYMVESELAQKNTIPVLYFDNVGESFYDGSIQDIVIVSDKTAVQSKLAELTVGSDFSYVGTPNWHQSGTDATFREDGFTYTYDSSNSAGGRRYLTGVNDRVFLSGNYFYEYEISGDITSAGSNDVYGLFFNWINSKTLSGTAYKHEAIFALKLNGDKLQRLTFDKGNGANGDGASGWVSNTTAYGGRNDLESDAAWQAAFKQGLIVRIERTVKDSTTDIYVISVTAKSDPSLKLTSTPIEVSDSTFGGYNWILFGTQSVNCTVSNVVSIGHLHTWEYSYAWTGESCKASRRCEDCGVTESETAQGQLANVNPATKDAPGKKTYTATFQNADFNENFEAYAVQIPANTAFAITEGGMQTYTFDGISASKNYYIEVNLGASTKNGYVGLAHWADEDNHFYNAVSYDSTEKYYHSFSGVVNGVGRVYSEPAKFYKDATNFGENGMIFAALRTEDVIHTFVNGKRIGTYLIEEELAQKNTVPVLYFNDAQEGFYNGQINDIVILTEADEVSGKLAELTAGSEFGYVATPNFHQSFTDATFTDDGFTYAYNSANSASDRRFVTGVNDRVFLSGNYYYQYEISGDMAFVNGSNMYGLLYNWINTKSQTQYGNYKHEANFVLKLNGNKLQRLTFDKGSGANGDGASGWVSNTTAYGGRNDLENDAAWQAAYKDGLIVRIERTVKDSKTDIYVISVTAKSDPSLKLTSTPVEVSDDTFGGFNWILFGTQSVNCTISNVTFGHK